MTHRLIKAGKSVLMPEAGPDDNNQFVRMPGGYVRLFSIERVQMYLSEPRSAAGGRSIAVPYVQHTRTDSRHSEVSLLSTIAYADA